MKESMCSRWHLRLIVLLILFFPLTLSAAQGRVTVKGQSITLRQAIKIIEVLILSFSSIRVTLMHYRVKIWIVKEKSRMC